MEFSKYASAIQDVFPDEMEVSIYHVRQYTYNQTCSHADSVLDQKLLVSVTIQIFIRVPILVNVRIEQLSRSRS